MSYTVAVHGKKPLDGSVCLKALADTSETFLVEGNGKPSSGFTELNNQSCIGVGCIISNPSDVKRISSIAAQHFNKCLSGGIKVEYVLMNGVTVLYATFLTRDPHIGFVSEIFDGVLSPSWIMENTACYDSYNRYTQIPRAILEADIKYGTPLMRPHPSNMEGWDAHLAPPRLIRLDGGIRKVILFPVGYISRHFDEDPRGQSYKKEREAQDIYLRDCYLSSDLFYDEIAKNDGRNIPEGLERMCLEGVTGLQHGFTVVYPDLLNEQIKVSHMLHETVVKEGSFKHLLTEDKEENEIVVTGEIAAQRFISKWPISVYEPFQNIEGVYTRIVHQPPRYGIERETSAHIVSNMPIAYGIDRR
jgi:hypothetical protein